MSRTRGVLALLVLCALGVAAVGATAATAEESAPTKLTVWVGWSARELSVFKKVAAEYDQAHPKSPDDVLGSINDDKIVAAIRAGNAPDVASSFNSYDVGIYCGTGGWIDLSSKLKSSGIPLSSFPAATNYYTQFGGKKWRCRCWPIRTGSTTTRISSGRQGSPARRRRSPSSPRMRRS